MESINDDYIMGYWIGGTFICKDCIGKAEAEGIAKEDVVVESNMDEGADYICVRCNRRI
jgi:hypothetical protein